MKTHNPQRGVWLFVAALWLAVSGAQAQMNTYSFSQSTQAFQFFNPDSVIGTVSSDDQTFHIKLKFPFRFGDTIVDRVRFSPNGIIAMGSEGATFFNGTNGYRTSTNPDGMVLRSRQGINRNVIASFVSDLSGNRTSSQIGVKWNLTGGLGNRSVVFQMKKFRRWSSRFAGDTISFQTELKENGQIVIRYGAMTIVQGVRPLGIQVGLRGEGPNDVLSLKGAWGAPTTSTSAFDTLMLTQTLFPVSGTTYTFSPRPLVATNLAVIKTFVANSNISTLNCSFSEPLTLGVVVYNWGLQPVSTTQVGYRVGINGVPVTQAANFSPALQPYEADTVYFSGPNAFVPPASATYPLFGFVNAPSDPIPSNDTVRASLLVRGPVPIILNTNIPDLTNARRQGWRQGQGATAPTRDSVNFYRSGFPGGNGFNSSISGYIDGAAPTALPQWYYLPTRIAGGPISIKFKLGFTRTFAGVTSTDMGDDTVKLVVSRDCGNSWQTIARFDQRDLTSGRVDNSPKEFTYQVSNSGGNFVVAFYYTSNATPHSTNYRFHLDDIRFTAAIDGAATALTFPSGRFPGCALTTQEPVTIRVRNDGTTPITQLNAGYSLDGAAFVSRDFAVSPIQPGQTGQVTFTGTQAADLSGLRTYRFKGYIRLNQDGTTANDTVIRIFNTAGGNPIPGPPRSFDMPSARANGWKLASGNPITSDTSFWWRPVFLQSGNALGMHVDNVAGTSTNLYEWFYLPGGRTTGQVGINFKLAVSTGLTGGTFTRPGPNVLNDDTLKLVVSNDCGTTWRTIAAYSNASLAANVVNETFKDFAHTLTTGTGSIQVAFVFTSNGTVAPSQYRWVLDDIAFISANDLQAAHVEVPGLRFTGCDLTNQMPLNIEVKNQGSQPATQAVVSYRIGTAAPVSQTVQFTPALQAGQVKTISFTGNLGAALQGMSGPLALQAIVTLTGGDGNRANDTLTRNYLVGPVASQPIEDDTIKRMVDARDQGWHMAQGNPISRDTNYIWRSQNINILGGEVLVASAADSTKNKTYWLYRTNMQSAGPVAIRFQAAIVKVQANRRMTDIGNDTMEVVVTRDCGETWEVIRSFSQIDLNAGRIDSVMRTFGGQLVAEPGNFSVAFRLRVGNTVPIPYHWVFDNIIISTSLDVAIASVASPTAPGSQYCIGQPLPVSVVVTNKGIQQIDSVTISYRINGGPKRSQSFRVDLASGANKQVNFDPSLAITGLTGTFTLSFQISTPGEASDDTANNTVNVPFTMGAMGTFPQGPFVNPAMAAAAGWTQQRKTQDGWLIGGLYWGPGRAFATASAAVTVNPNGNEFEQRYLMSPSFAPAQGITVSFNTAVTASYFNASRINSIGDDSLVLAFRTNCGPWQPLKVFTQADIAANQINNSLQSFDIAVVPFAANDTVQVAFYIANGGTDYALPGGTYVWHVTNIVLSDAVGVRDRMDSELSLAPNPARDRVRVTLRNGEKHGQVRLVDLQGRPVLVSRLDDGALDIKLTGLPKGLYLVEVLTDSGRALKRLVIE